MPRLSAGRVQSVATRMVVERERARMRFRSAAWWGIDGTFTPDARPRPRFGAALVALDGVTLASGRDFDDDGGRPAPARWWCWARRRPDVWPPAWPARPSRSAP